MAIIEKRTQKDGTVSYRARVRLQGHPKRSQTFARKTDAVSWARQIEADLKRGRYVPSTEAMRRTVADMVDRYVTDTLPNKKRNRDADKVESQLAWWKERIGSVAVANVTPALIVECRDELLAGKTRRGTRRTPATVNRYLAALSGCFKVALREWHWIEQTPMPAVGRGEEHPGVIRFLSDKERDALLRACAAHSVPWLRPLVLMALSTGARRGELLGLKWSDLDMVRGVVTFHVTKNRERRAVPVAGAALEVMRAWSKVRRLDSDLVFPGPSLPVPAVAGQAKEISDRPLYIEKVWREVLAAAGIKNFRFHDLRHSAASYLAMSGATAPEIAAVLGHKTLQMVKRYAHLGEQHTASVVERMTNKFLPGTEGETAA